MTSQSVSAATTLGDTTLPVVHIGPARSWASLNLTELVEYRDDPRSATVFIESQTDDQIVHGPGVDTYQQIVAELTSLGLGGTDAVALVNEIRSEI